MIFFKKIKWKNFLSTGNVWTEMSLSSSKSTLIVGENGAGKSTLLDALCFVLYGKPFRKINKPQLVNSINNKGLEVEVEFSIGKREYRIRRGHKPAVFEIYQDGTLINQASETRDYQEMFERNILKLNFKSFSQIVILGSASFVPFMQLPAAHRREVIEDLLDIQIFSTMNGILKTKIAQNKTDLVEVDFEMRSIAEKIELYKKHVAELKHNNDELVNQKRAQIDQYATNIDFANSAVVKLQAEIATLQSSINDQAKVRAKLEKVRELSRQIDNKLEKIQTETEFFTSHSDCPTCRQGIADDHKTEILEKGNTQIAEIQSGKAKLLEKLARLDNRLADISNVSVTISDKNREVSENLIQIRTWDNFVKSIEAEIDSLSTNTLQIDSKNDEIKNLKSDLKTSIDRKNTLASDKQLYDVATVLLKDTGIKTKIIKQYVPIMNKLINKYLASMEFFVNFELNESFDETIKSRFRDEFSYESFSEGEKSRIDLALIFTWRAISKLRNSASTNLLILDEIFDSSLDTTGSDELMKILNTPAGDTNVFVISHKGDQLFDKFDSVIKFEKHKNFSRMIA